MTDTSSHLNKIIGVFHNLGWEEGSYEIKTKLVRRGGRALKCAYFFLPESDETGLMILVPLNFYLTPQEKYVNMYLDIDYDLFLIATFASGRPDDKFLALLDKKRAVLIDLTHRERLLWCDSEREQTETFLPLLNPRSLTLGSMEKLPHKSPEALGKELKEWLNLWAAEIGSTAGKTKRFTYGFFYKFLLAREFLLLSASSDNKGPDFSVYAAPLGESPTKKSLKKPWRFLRDVIDFTAERAGLPHLSLSDEEAAFLTSLSHKEKHLARLLSECNFLSHSKFNSSVYIHAFGNPKRIHKSLKKSFTYGEVDVKSLLHHKDVMVYQPAEVDVREEGYSWMLKVFDEVALYWREFNERRSSGEIIPKFSTMQMDFFQSVPEGISKSGAIEDVLSFVIESSFRLKNIDDNEKDLLRLLLASRIMELRNALNLQSKRPVDLSKV